MRVRLVAVMAMAGGLAAACGANPDLTYGTVAPAPAITTTVPASTTTLAQRVLAPPGPSPVTMAFGGDIHAEPPISGVLAAGANPLEYVAPLLTAADIAVVNVETAVGTSGTPADKSYVFQAPTSLLESIADAGADIVSVANNHSYDMGEEGFFETLDNVRAAGLTPIGGGRNEAEAYAPAIVDVAGTKVAVIGLAKIGPDDSQRAEGNRAGTTNGRDRARTVAAVEAARAQAPVVIVFVHWGAELAECPEPNDVALAEALADAGASAVIGMHPHVLQGITQRADGKLVAWSIGNFVFYASSDVPRQSGVLTLTLRGDGAVSAFDFAPARIDGEGRPRPVEGADADAIRDRITDLTPGAGTCPAVV